MMLQWKVDYFLKDNIWYVRHYTTKIFQEKLFNYDVVTKSPTEITYLQLSVFLQTL